MSALDAAGHGTAAATGGPVGTPATARPSRVTTHVLDTARGRPAAGVPVELVGPGGECLARAVTGDDGRVAALGPPDLPAGAYRLVFATAAYAAATGQDVFFPAVTVDFLVTDTSGHLHVPLLLSPFGYSTYRGS